MPLAYNIDRRIAFDKAAIMRRAHHEGRFALRLCRTITERRAQLSNWLRKAWAAAKAEACELRRAEERAAAIAAFKAQHEREAAALAASFSDDAAAIRWEIQREHYRQHFNGDCTSASYRGPMSLAGLTLSAADPHGLQLALFNWGNS